MLFLKGLAKVSYFTDNTYSFLSTKSVFGFD